MKFQMKYYEHLFKQTQSKPQTYIKSNEGISELSTKASSNESLSSE